MSQILKIKCFTDYHWPSVRDFLGKRSLDRLERVGDATYARQISEGVLLAQYIPELNIFSVQLLPGKCLTTLDIAAPLKNNNVTHQQTIQSASNLALDEVSSELLTQYRSNLERVLGCLTPWPQVYKALTATGIAANRIPHGLSIAGVWSPFEALLRAICGQQVSVGAAVTQVNRVVELALNTQNADNNTLVDLPSVDVFARTDFSSLGMPKRRKQTLLDSIIWWQKNTPELNKLIASQTYIENAEALLLEDLLAVKGIGPWTISYLRLRGFAEPDVMLDNDLIVKQQLAKNVINADAAKPWRSYLCLLLWEWSTLEKQQKG